MSCINYKHPDVAKIAGELNISPVVAAAKIGVWQSKNNIKDRFPTIDELSQSNDLNTTLKAVDILQSDKATILFKEVDFTSIIDDNQDQAELKDIVELTQLWLKNLLHSVDEQEKQAEEIEQEKAKKAAKAKNTDSEIVNLLNFKKKHAYA